MNNLIGIGRTMREENGGDGGDNGGGGGDVAAQLAAAMSQIEQYKTADNERAAGKDAADAATEAARVAALSAADKLTEDRAAFAADVDASKAGFRAEAMGQALDKLQVKENYRDYVPAVDPRTDEGRGALEAWIKGHPEAVQSREAPQATWEPKPKSVLQKIMSGELRSPLVSADAVRQLMGRK